MIPRTLSGKKLEIPVKRALLVMTALGDEPLASDAFARAFVTLAGTAQPRVTALTHRRGRPAATSRRIGTIRCPFGQQHERWVAYVGMMV